MALFLIRAMAALDPKGPRPENREPWNPNPGTLEIRVLYCVPSVHRRGHNQVTAHPVTTHIPNNLFRSTNPYGEPSETLLRAAACRNGRR